MINSLTSDNVVDFRSYQQARQATSRAQPISARNCRHCGAGLMDGESDDDCSILSATDAVPAPRRIYAE